MGRDGDLHQRITRRSTAAPGIAFAAKAQGLTVLQSRRDRDVDGLAIGHGQALHLAIRGIEEIDRQSILRILPAHRAAPPFAEGE
jgi:hypothetical protein